MDDRFEFRTDLDVSLVRSSASDNDVIFAARVSTLGERAASSNTDGDARLISYLMRERHGSPFEHNSMTFFVRAPIFVFRELMRHRIASYNEESARYRQLSPIFYIPSRRRPLVQTGKPGHYQFVEGTPEQSELVERCYRETCETAYLAYEGMLRAGIAREVARGVLPVTIFSSAYVTINARSLMNVLSLRVRDDTSRYPSYPQYEIEVVARQMEDLWAQLMPLTHQAFQAFGRVAP